MSALDPSSEFPWENEVLIPTRAFLYTLEQISTMISMPEAELVKVAFFVGRTRGVPNKNRLTVRNLASPAADPIWRVSEGELIRWLKLKGYRFKHRAEIYD